MERGHAVALRGIDVGTLFEEGAHRILISAHRGIRDGSIGRGRKNQSAHAQGADQYRSQNRSHASLLTR